MILQAGGPLSYAPLLIKKKETPPQSKTSSRSKRIANLRDSFAVTDREKLAGARVILIDDVITTGATLEEARKTLRKAGAKEILALAVAH